MDNGNVISVLNHLIETCRDGEQGFRTAAENVKDPQVKSLFQHYAQQRGEMIRELQSEVRAHGGDPETAGSVAASAHRGWMNIKAAISSGDAGIIAEAERGEDYAKDAYDKAVKEGLPPTTLAIVRQQAEKIRQAHDRVRDLEKAGTKR